MEYIDGCFEGLFDKNVLLFAHTPMEQGEEKQSGVQQEKETLQEHIGRCDAYFHRLDKEKHFEKVIRNFCQMMYKTEEPWVRNFVFDLFHQMVPYHDLGKCNPKFQRETMKNTRFTGEDWEGIRGTGHSFLSALIYVDHMVKQVEEVCARQSWDKTAEKKTWERRLKVLILEHAYVISRHHANLGKMTDFLDELVGEETEKLTELARQTPGYHIFSQGEAFWRERGKLKNLFIQWKRRETREESMAGYLYMRFLYSVLVSCDYYATSEYRSHVAITEFGSCTNMDDYIRAYGESERMKAIRRYEEQCYEAKTDISVINEMNELRSHMFLDVEKEYERNPNQPIYFLEAPTGSGKSNTALNISFRMMKEKKKLFYIYPFNTLVDQNRKTLEELFPQKQLREQMVVVNSLTPIPMRGGQEEYEMEAYYSRALLDRQFLNYPVLITTHVSFFSLLFGSGKTDVFGFLQLIDSVAVMDEIQSYKNSIWAEMILFLRTCAKLMGMQIVIMSATLPGLETLAGKEGHVVRLLKNRESYFSHPIFRDRVSISYELLREGTIDMERLYDHVRNQYDGKKKILMEFIKKESAYAFYRMICERGEGMRAVCMTGDDSAYEREKILDPIRSGNVEGIILVATQVVEAGVDIDMDLGYKDISKLDSEEQFMGRINRSCRRHGNVYFFEMDSAKSIYKNDIQLSESLTLKNSRMQQILREKQFGQYYELVLEELKRGKNDLTNEEGLEQFFKDHVGMLDFPGIEARMRLIEERDWLVSVVLCRVLERKDGEVLDGRKVWEQYKALLCDRQMGYAEKQIKLSRVKSKLSYFLYQVKKPVLDYSDLCGELYCYYNGEDYLENGKLNREKLGGGTLFW